MQLYLLLYLFKHRPLVGGGASEASDEPLTHKTKQNEVQKEI